MWVIVVFNTITDYLVLVVYLSAILGFPKREVYRATTSYASLTDELRSRVPARVFDLARWGRGTRLDFAARADECSTSRGGEEARASTLPRERTSYGSPARRG